MCCWNLGSPPLKRPLWTSLALIWTDTLSALSTSHNVFPCPTFLVGQGFSLSASSHDANTPEAMVDLAVATGIRIDADDFRALLRSGSTECWVVRGEDNGNPIVHLQRVFRV